MRMGKGSGTRMSYRSCYNRPWQRRTSVRGGGCDALRSFPMRPKNETPSNGTRLAELMASIGCQDEIAPVDSNTLGAKVAEVIVRALSPHLLNPKRSADFSRARHWPENAKAAQVDFEVWRPAMMPPSLALVQGGRRLCTRLNQMDDRDHGELSWDAVLFDASLGVGPMAHDGDGCGNRRRRTG